MHDRHPGGGVLLRAGCRGSRWRSAAVAAVATVAAGLVATATPALAEPPEPPPEVEAQPTGARADARGRLVLPASGLGVKVPRPAWKTTEAFGRVAFMADGPEVSDEVAVLDDAGLLALSVVVGGEDCAAFDALGVVEQGVKVGRHAWSRLDQSQVVIEGVTERDAPMRATVWCRPGVLVHSVAREAHPLLPAWLDALASAQAPTAISPPPPGSILVETDAPDEAKPLPVLQRFALTAARALWETRLPVGRVPEPAGSRPLGAPDRDRFEVLTPRALLVSVTVEATAEGSTCQAPAPSRAPRADSPWPAAFSPSPGAKVPLAACLSRADGPPLAVRVEGRGPPPLLLAAAAPILQELASLLASPRPQPRGD